MKQVGVRHAAIVFQKALSMKHEQNFAVKFKEPVAFSRGLIS
jgi:hypothetical protein